MAIRSTCVRCGRRVDHARSGEGERTCHNGPGLCPRCTEWHAQRDMHWNLAFVALIFACAPAAVAVISALR